MKQITVLSDDHPGVAAQLCEVLAQNEINIETIVGDTASAHGVINLTVDRYDEALSALRDAGFTAVSEEALVIVLRDEPGALARVAAKLAAAGINIRSMRILRREGGKTWVALVTPDNQAARSLVDDVLVGPSVAPPPPED